MSFARRVVISTSALCLLAFEFHPPNFIQAQAQTSILGFTPSSAAHQAEVENKFKAIPSPDEERRQHHLFTAEPHVAGSARNNELARYIADQWRTEGLEDVVIRRYDVLRQQSQVHLAGNGCTHSLPRHPARVARSRRSRLEEQKHQLGVERYVGLRRSYCPTRLRAQR